MKYKTARRHYNYTWKPISAEARKKSQLKIAIIEYLKNDSSNLWEFTNVGSVTNYVLAKPKSLTNR